jgi:hypothetical protein
MPGIAFFWVNNPREVNEFASTTVVLAVVLPLRILGMLHSIMDTVCNKPYVVKRNKNYNLAFGLCGVFLSWRFTFMAFYYQPQFWKVKLKEIYHNK